MSDFGINIDHTERGYVMNNIKTRFALAAFYIAVLFFIGCVPEDSLQWSEDGSVGLLRVDGALYIVDGETGELSEVAKSDVCMLPDISDDGRLIAYCQEVKCSNLSEGLKVLPAGQVKMVQYYAEETRKNVMNSGGLVDDKFPFPEGGLLVPGDYRNWAIRYFCENADGKLLEVLGKEGIEKGKEKELVYFQVIVAPRKNLSEKRVAAVNLFATMSIRLSPDGRSVAYLMHTQEGEVSNAYEECGLYVAALDSDIKAMRVDSRVAFSYDWREDGKTIAYISADSRDMLHDEPILGTLNEREVTDANGRLQAGPTAVGERGSAWTHQCGGRVRQHVGILFYPWLKVEYGPGGRLFFSSAVLTLPASTRDDPRWTLFCYDPVTATIADVLPASVSSYTSDAVDLLMFDLSPDGKNVLLPTKNNRFIRYTLGKDSMKIPVEEDEGYKDDNMSAYLSVWKGNDEISYLASEKSRFLRKEGQEKHHRKEFVILGADGEFRRVLSESWPDLTQMIKDD
jgi:hypothetical protein